MPNHTRNEIIESTGDVDKYIRNADGVIDFEVVSPMPAILHRVISPPRSGEKRLMVYYTEEEAKLLFKEHKLFLGREATEEEQEQIAACSHTNWYSWALHHWGTKWNAYHTEAGQEVFDTAWDSPHGWFDALRKAMPKGTGLKILSTYECGSPSQIFDIQGEA